METTTPFDLNRAIQQWRENLAQSPAIRAENLDELETHLRDSVSTLQARDLSVDEAFLIAAKRVGSGAVLGKEFGKVNAVNVWVERCLWALVAMQIWGALQEMFFSIGHYLRFGFVDSGGTSFGWATVFYVIFGTAIPMAFAALIIWRLFKSPESKLGKFLEGLSIQPAALAGLLFVLNAGGHLCYAFVLNYSSYMYGRVSWAAFTYFLPGSLVYTGLIFLLARKLVLRKA
jgi:hypothetical protein